MSCKHWKYYVAFVSTSKLKRRYIGLSFLTCIYKRISDDAIFISETVLSLAVVKSFAGGFKMFSTVGIRIHSIADKPRC